MKNFLFIAAALLSIATTTLSAQDKAKPVHLFILSGQSNMAGLKPEIGFLPEAKKLLPEGEVVHMKVARGGQPIRLWVKEWNEIVAKHDIKVTVDKTPYYDQILAQFKTLQGKFPQGFASISFSWMQGERDAKEKLSAAYKEAMKTLIANLRRDLKAPKMNVVIGRLSDYGDGKAPEWEAVRDILVAVATEDKHGAWVDTDDLNNKVKKEKPHNDLHYTKEGYKLFGERLAQQSVKLINGEKPSATGK
ncbi:MAG: sialate O-acetylesterase [Verrucomicrobiales bacterium]